MFTADIMPPHPGGADSQDSCQPTSTGWISYFNDYHGGNYYDRHTPELHYREGNYCGVAYAKFDLTPIPDSSRVMSAQWRCYQYEVISTPLRTRCTYVGLNPDTASETAVYVAVRSGPVLADTQRNSTGWVTYGLSGQGVTILQGRPPTDWVALGIIPVTGEGTAYGLGGGDFTPYPRIEYTVSGAYESRCTYALLPLLAFAPNPACDRTVTVRCALAVGSKRMLTIRNVVGRVVRTFVLDPSGVARLDLIDLSPGVYVAILDAAVPRISRKLVITSR
jgi:hypothetical protein